MTSAQPTAAVLLIGDEILSGRTKDKNLGFIADYMTALESTCARPGWCPTWRRRSWRR